MGYSFILADSAQRDIDSISAYLDYQLKSPQAAEDFLSDVEAGCRRVTEMPKAYPLYNDMKLAIQGYRKIVIKNYLIFYRIKEEEKAIYVTRVIYGGRDYSELL